MVLGGFGVFKDVLGKCVCVCVCAVKPQLEAPHTDWCVVQR